jgi:Enoyl-(Acyl carrier protein) reductase
VSVPPLLKDPFAKDPQRAAKRLVHIPMGRFGEPEEIAKAAPFLAGDDSSFVTANTFLIDGGLSAAYLTPIQTGRVLHSKVLDCFAERRTTPFVLKLTKIVP